MSRRWLVWLSVAVCAGGLVAVDARPACAQALVWSLPPQDATWVRFEGTYKTRQARRGANQNDVELEWRAELTIKSVGREQAMYDGRPTMCRWLEFKSVTGKESDQGLQPGPSGTRIYKILVPEERGLGRLTDADGIPMDVLPRAKGSRKIGDRDVEPMRDRVFSAYPMITLLTYYPNMKGANPQPEPPVLPTGDVATRAFSGSVVLESDTIRSTNQGTIWLTREIPFGVAKFQATVNRLEKDITATKDQFKPASDTTVEMTIVAIGNDARTEIAGTP